VSGSGAGPAIQQWETIADPIALSAAMWDHMGKMRQAGRGKWPALTPQEMTDIVVYVQTLPGGPKRTPEFSPASAATGAELFRVKGCQHCHAGKNALGAKVEGRSMNDLAAALWNHGGRLHGDAPSVSVEEMRRLVGYLWTTQFFNRPGNAARGRQVFAAKGCGNCHGQGAPKLEGKRLTPFAMVGGLWTHGPRMRQAMARGKVGWPRFEGAEMSDLLAFLNAQEGGGENRSAGAHPDV
jgi:cytochrome c551/c552